MSRQKHVEMNAPTRQSIVGPGVLSTLTAPGAIRKSMAVRATSTLATETNITEEALKASTAAKEFIQTSGRINIITTIDIRKDLLCCQYNEDYDYLAAGSSDGYVNLYQSDSGDYVLSLYDSELVQNPAPVTGIKHRPVTKYYPTNYCFTCTYSNGLVKCWNYNFNQCIYTIRENRQTFGITYHPRLPKFVTFGDDSKIYLYDEESKIQERILTSSANPDKCDGHTSRIFAACFNPRSNHELITGGWDNVVHFWDLRQPHAVRHLTGVHICGESIDINMKGTEIITCAYQHEHPLQLWAYSTGKLINTLEPDDHPCKLYSGRFINEDFAICGGSDENLIRIVDMQTEETKGMLSGFITGIYGIDVGPPKKEKKQEKMTRQKSDFASLPKIAFVSGKKMYQIDFY